MPENSKAGLAAVGAPVQTIRREGTTLRRSVNKRTNMVVVADESDRGDAKCGEELDYWYAHGP